MHLYRNLRTEGLWSLRRVAADHLGISISNGQVDYMGLKADPKALDRYLTTLATVSGVQLQSWTESQQLAFFINLYNASTLRLILDNYPVKSIKDIGSLFTGPWDQPAVRLFGKTVTLNTLEHALLRKQYHEPRLHMALVCAAKGCPPLRSEAYTAERLNEQLDAQARTYLASPAGLHIDRAGAACRRAWAKWCFPNPQYGGGRCWPGRGQATAVAHRSDAARPDRRGRVRRSAPSNRSARGGHRR